MIGNSIKFTEEYGVIEVTGLEMSRIVEIRIADSGKGIPEEEISNIFKPFYKIDKSRAAGGPASGNGIGLSIVKRIIDLHRGDIYVTSPNRQPQTIERGCQTKPKTHVQKT